jgi:hypothetical protein
LFVISATDFEKDSYSYAVGNNEYASMLSSHLLGPLFLEYEAQIKQFERDLKTKKLEVQR